MAGPPPAESPRRRCWLRWLAVLVVLLAALLLGVWTARVPLAQWAIETYGARLGFGQLSLTLTRLDLDGADARDVRLGGLSAVAVTATYDLSSLRARRLDALVIDGLRVAGRIEAGAIAIEGLPLPAGASGPLAFPVLPVDRIALTNAEADLATPAGPVRLAATLTATEADAGYGLNGTLDVTSPDGTATVSIDGRVGPGDPTGIAADVAIDATAQARDATVDLAADAVAAVGADHTGAVSVTLREGSAAHDRATVEGLTGRIDVGLGPFAVDARLGYTAARVQRADLGAGTVAATLKDDAVSLAATVKTPQGRGTVALETRLDAAAPVSVRIDGAMPAAAAGLIPGATAQAGEARVALAATLPPFTQLATPRTPAEWLAAARVAGTVDFDLQGVAYTGLIDAADVAGRLRVDTTATEVRIDATDALTLANMALALPLRDRLPAPVAEVLGERPTLRFLAPAVVLTPSGPTARMVTRATLGGLAAEIDATARLDPALRPLRIEAPYLGLRAAGLALGDLTVDADALVTDLRADLTVPRLIADLAASATASLALPGVALADPRADVTARIELDRDQLVLRPAAGSRLVVPGLGLRDRVALPRGVTVALADDAAWLMADLAADSVTYDLALAPLALDALVLLPGGRTTSATLRLPGPRLTSDGERHSLRVAGGGLTVAEPAIAGDNVALALDWSRGVLDADLRLPRLAATGTPPPFIPVGAAVNVRATQDAVDFVASLAAPLGPVDARIAGRHDLAARAGRARLTLAPVTFVPQVVQPADLAPVLGDRVGDVAGTVALDGTIAWTDVALTPDLRLGIDDVAFTSAAGEITGMSGAIAIDGLAPPATPPGQRLSGQLRLKQSVVPWTLDFQARRDGRIAVEQLRLEVAGGTVEARDVLVDPADRAAAATLELKDVDLGLLLAHLRVDGLSASGRISGAVPVRVADGRVAIDRGRLIASGGGRLSYTGAGVSDALSERDDSVGLAAKALRDFRYDDLTLELEKSPAGPGTLRLTVAGRNPALLDGHPFRLNIALDADFDRLALLLLEGLAEANDIAHKAALRLQR